MFACKIFILTQLNKLSDYTYDIFIFKCKTLKIITANFYLTGHRNYFFFSKTLKDIHICPRNCIVFFLRFFFQQSICISVIMYQEGTRRPLIDSFFKK